MDYRPLGRGGVQVSPLCLGTMTFGATTDEAVAHRIVAKALAAGVNLIDIADAYSNGRSEEIVGRAIQSQRQHWILASKVCDRMGQGVNDKGMSRRWIMLAAEASLRRLATSHIDIHYLHKEDPNTALEETVAAMADLIRQGKIRYFGLSNYRSCCGRVIVHICDRMGIDRPIASQPYYNAMNLMPEVEHLPACSHYGLGVAPYSPLARGVLTGKYDPQGPPPAQSRAARQDTRMLQTEWRPESLKFVGIIKQHAQSRSMTAGQFALNWVLNNRLVTVALAGPRTEEQWDDYVAALDHPCSADDEALVDQLVAPGHRSTAGYNDPAYPIEGRQLRTGRASRMPIMTRHVEPT
jgi:aryl-alcohol dehydrogenase-like predicted oxidoreductase